MIVVITLIAVNCALIGTLWYNRYERQPPPAVMPPPAGNAFEYLCKELKLTPEQVKKYKALRDEHFTFTSKISQEMRLARDTFFNALKKPAVSAEDVNMMEMQVLVRQQKLDTATFNHFRKLRAILTPVQQNKFDNIIQSVLRMMAGPHGPTGEQHPGQPGAGPPQAGTLPVRGQLNRRPGMGRPPGGPPRPPFGRPDGPPPGFGPDGPPPQGPPPDGPPGPTQ